LKAFIEHVENIPLNRMHCPVKTEKKKKKNQSLSFDVKQDTRKRQGCLKAAVADAGWSCC